MMTQFSLCYDQQKLEENARTGGNGDGTLGAMIKAALTEEVVEHRVKKTHATKSNVEV